MNISKIISILIVCSVNIFANAADFYVGEFGFTIENNDFVSVSYNGNKLTIDDIIKIQSKTENPGLLSNFELIRENWDKYFLTSKTLEVPSKVDFDGKSYIVSAVEDNGFYRAADLYKIILPETINRIGVNAFSESTIREIVLPSGLLVIDEFAFCSSAIKCINIPEQLRFLGKGIFYECSNLDLITFDSNVKISDIPAKCFEYSGLSEINLPESIKIIGDNAFENSNLHIFTSGNLDVIGESCFKYCSLTEFNCKSAREIKQEAFYRCYLKELEIDTQILGYNSLNCGFHSGTRIVRFLNDRVPKGINTAFGFYNDGPAGVISVPNNWYWTNDNFTDDWVPLSFNFRYDKIDEFGFTFYNMPDKQSYIYINPNEKIYVKKGSNLIIGWEAVNMGAFEVRHNGEIVDHQRLMEYTVNGLSHNIFYRLPQIEDSIRIYMTSTTGIEQIKTDSDTNEVYDVYSISGHLIGLGMTFLEMDNMEKGTYIIKTNNKITKIRI